MIDHENMMQHDLDYFSPGLRMCLDAEKTLERRNRGFDVIRIPTLLVLTGQKEDNGWLSP